VATFSQLPSGKWRVQVRRAGIYRAATFPTKHEAAEWASDIETQAHQVAESGFAPLPRRTTVADLIDEYAGSNAKTPGKTKAATLAMLKREMGKVKLPALNALALRDFIDRRIDQGAGGVTIAADLSFLSSVLKWGRHARQLDIPERLALEARGSLKHRGLNTRAAERSREPTDCELKRLYDHWRSKPRQLIDMELMCRFAIASGMRLAEICRIAAADVDAKARTVVIRDRKGPRHKAGNDQTVPLLSEAWKIVRGRLPVADGGLLFPYRAESVSTAFTRACADLVPPIVDLHFHDLRHRAMAQFFRMGLDIPRVALLTGHKTWTMLRRYSDVKPEDVHAAVSRKPSRIGRAAPKKLGYGYDR
jgi:integrase